MTQPPLVIVRPSRRLPPKHADPIPVLARPRLAAPEHPYDAARPGQTPLEFADYVLARERLLTDYRGVEYVDGRIATALLKVREANRALRRLGLEPITGDAAWELAP